MADNSPVLHQHRNFDVSQESGQSREHSTTMNSSHERQRPYFMRTSLNSSIKARHSHRRSQTGGRRSSRRRLSGRPQRHLRQVRFQPIPQAINISAYSSSSGGCGDGGPNETSRVLGADEEVAATGGVGCGINYMPGNNIAFIKGKQFKRVQQQLTRLSRKSKIQLTSAKPKFSTKPLQHFNHIKSSFGKIKLKSLNNLASQLQQKLTNLSMSSQYQHQHQHHQANGHAASQQASQVVVEPIQRTFHLRHSAASATRQITLKISKHKPESNNGGGGNSYDFTTANSQQEASSQQQVAELDDGWGSDFDETQSSTDADNSAPLNSTMTTTRHDESNSTVGTSAGYLLEIGKSSCDTRAVGDVIQDQGICGQFKRLHDVSFLDIPSQPARTVDPTPSQYEQTSERPTARLEQIRESLQEVDLGSARQELQEAKQIPDEEAEEHNDDDEEEAELRSLEARQGFRQVRDKLKLILDQRLASYKRDLTNTTSKGQEQPQQQQLQQLKTDPCHVVECGQGGQQQAKRNQVDHHPAEAKAQAMPHHDRFDCQSNCSEASSLSSGGLDSNHSGSQDSGHSTQHSGYSAIGHRHRRSTSSSALLSNGDSSSGHSPPVTQPATGTETSPTNQLDSGASTCGDEPQQATAFVAVGSTGDLRDSPPSISVPSSSFTTSPLSPTCGTGASAACQQQSASEEEEEERRNRFLQNRLIINSKLESMFKSRSAGTISTPARERLAEISRPSPVSTATTATKQARPSPSKSIQSCPTPRSLSRPQLSSELTMSSCQNSPVSAVMRPPQAATSLTPLDSATRLQLLEQQRQMSLKLKQKPRRRTARQALNLDSSRCSSSSNNSACCNASLDNQSITTTSEEIVDSYYNLNSSLVLSSTPTNSRRPSEFSRESKNQESLTKQLSMVCLRQLEHPCDEPHSPTCQPNVVLWNNQQRQHQHQQQHQQQRATTLVKPALSLRQLVKEVIDDCEKPSKLSTLTRNALNRSDSLSSQDGGGSSGEFNQLG